MNEELERLLTGHFGVRRRVASFERRPCPFASSHVLEELDVLLDDGTRLELLRKRTACGAAHGVKPTFLRDPLREAWVYRALLGPAELEVPVLYGVGGEGALEGPWLLLERVSGRELYQVGETGAWEAAARWVALLHVRFRGFRPPPAARLVVHDPTFHRRWLRRARALARLEGAPPATRRALDSLEQPVARAADRLATLPRTLLHGEYYASNVLVEGEGPGTVPRPVDWEMASLGPGVIDLAALIAGGWEEAARERIVWAYRDALERAGGHPANPVRFRGDLEAARLCLAVQWLGWSARWSPPPEQAGDWLAEARAAAARVVDR